MLKSILVPLDGSLRAERALPVAARIARATGGSLHLLQVVTPSVEYGSSLAPVPLATGEIIDAEIQQATNYLKAISTSQVLAGIATSTEVGFGFAAQQLLDVAQERTVDLIVMCSHGRTGFTRWVLGSIAHKVTHLSAVPMLVLHEGGSALASNQPDSTGCLTRVLVSLDGSELAEAVLRPAAELILAISAPAPGALHLMQVVKNLPASAKQSTVSEPNEQAVERAEVYLATVKARLHQEYPDSCLAITCSVVLDNDIAGALIGTAEAWGEEMTTQEHSGCHLIAMSTHGRGGIERWMVGSITERVLDTTRLPMLIVRPNLTNK